MDPFMNHLPELAAAAATLWGVRERMRRSKAQAMAAAAEAAKAALAARLDKVSDIAQRFADALGKPGGADLAAMRDIEAERKARGL